MNRAPPPFAASATAPESSTSFRAQNNKPPPLKLAPLKVRPVARATRAQRELKTPGCAIAQRKLFTLWRRESARIKSAAALLFFLLAAPLHVAHAANAPLGGGGSCSYGLEPDGTVAQQQAYDNGLYTCLSGGTWTPEALIIGSTLASGSAATCNSTNAGMLEYSGGTIEYCNGTTFTDLGSGGTLDDVDVELAAGTAAAPSLTFYADTQTGLYQGTASTLEITTGGVERAAFDASGNFNLIAATGAYEIGSNKVLDLPAADTVYSLAIGVGVLTNDNNGVASTYGGGENAQYNTGVGYQALQQNTGGSENTAFGVQALQSVTTGSGDTGIGDISGEYITTGTDDVAIGHNTMTGVAATPLTGDYNTAVGHKALVSIQGAATGNTAVGAYTLQSATTASSNTAVGYRAGLYITTGSSNTALGPNAMVGTAGTPLTGATTRRSAIPRSTAQGAAATIRRSATPRLAPSPPPAITPRSATGAGTYATSGPNSALGSDALGYTTIGTQNTAIGTNAMVGVSATPLTGTTTTRPSAIRR